MRTTRRTGLRLLVALAFLVLATTTTPGAQPAGTYLVTRVIDGDTLVLERIGKVRLIGVDTPETVDPRRPVQRYGQEAGDFTRRLVDGKRVRVEYDWERTDKYNRTLAYIYLLDGTFVNAEIVRQGYGFAYTRFPFKHLEAFRLYEREAREHNRGQWAPEAPAVPAGRANGSAADRTRSETVYITRTGTKYHRQGCRSLSGGALAVALKDAAKTHSACKICRPPLP